MIIRYRSKDLAFSALATAVKDITVHDNILTVVTKTDQTYDIDLSSFSKDRSGSDTLPRFLYEEMQKSQSNIFRLDDEVRKFYASKEKEVDAHAEKSTH